MCTGFTAATYSGIVLISTPRKARQSFPKHNSPPVRQPVVACHGMSSTALGISDPEFHTALYRAGSASSPHVHAPETCLHTMQYVPYLQRSHFYESTIQPSIKAGRYRASLLSFHPVTVVHLFQRQATTIMFAPF